RDSASERLTGEAEIVVSGNCEVKAVMDVTLDCIPCFVRQALEASRMVGAGEAVQERVLRRVLTELSTIAFDQTPPYMATVIHGAIREEVTDEDPYREVKDRCNRFALSICEELRSKIGASSDPLETAVRIAIAGNIIDFGQGNRVDDERVEQTIDEALRQPLLAEMMNSFRSAVQRSEKILYLGDNAGEVVFDRLLIEHLPTERVTFVVRGGPVINDATRADAEVAGLPGLVEVVDTGSNAPGIILEFCSPEFRRRFAQADMIISKGQGNYETLSSVPAPIFFLLKVKCPVIAGHLGSNLGDLVVRRVSPRP
ncbi:MAG: damage-control phosphatase ARMT1 family protein, partial [Syntrophobacteria bacterium]